MHRASNPKAPAKSGPGERGIVLILALVALLLIAAVAATLIYMATSETSLVSAQKAGARSFYSAMGGIEEARYRLIPGLTAGPACPTGSQGGLNNTDPLSLACNTEAFARVPTIPPPGVPPSEILYVVNIPNGVAPANLDAIGSIPALAEDPTRAIEVPAAVTLRGVASIQLNSGTPNSLDWQWVRINVKTELASQQDLNLDGILDQDPVFLFQGRQYRANDLLVYDLDGLGPSLPGFVLPPPWGPNPLLAAPPITDRPCVAVICATPVYILTARGNVTFAGSPAANRMVRAEVGVPTAFALDAAIISQPGINLTGQMEASGRDICDPDCLGPTNNGVLSADDPDMSGNQAGLTDIFPPQNPAAGTGLNFNSYSELTVPANCRHYFPMQSEAKPADQTLNNTAARSDPHCDPANPSCKCQSNTVCGHFGCTTSYFSCVMADTPQQFDLDTLFSVLTPLARTMQEPVNNYYPQIDTKAGTPKVTCDATGCQGQSLQLGGFPFADPVAQTGADFINGANADPIITYVPGDFKCTSNCTGAGILLVDGDLELSASMSFYGIVLVRGNVTVLGGGSPNTPCNLYGSIITRGGVSTDLGGKICFQYNSCAQRTATYYAPLTGLSFREMPQ